MRKAILLILTGLFGCNITALADAERAKNLTVFQKQQIAWALRILSATKTLETKQDSCLQLDEDILKTLESEGHLEHGGVRPNSICIGK